MTILNITPQEDAVVFIGDSGQGISIQILTYDEELKDYIAVNLTGYDDEVIVSFGNKNNITNKTSLTFNIDNHVNGIIKYSVLENDFVDVGKGEYLIQATITKTSEGKKISTIYSSTQPNVLKVLNKI